MLLTPSFEQLIKQGQFGDYPTLCFLAVFRGDTRLPASCFIHHLLDAVSNVTRLPTCETPFAKMMSISTVVEPHCLDERWANPTSLKMLYNYRPFVHGWTSSCTRRNATCVHVATTLWRDQQGFPRVGFSERILQSWIRRNPQESIPGDTPLDK